MDVTQIAARIDHTLLAAEASAEQIEHVAHEALEHQFAAVCVNPRFLKRIKLIVANSPVAAATVVGFPLGANTTAMKVAEAVEAVEQGADEIDVVAHLPHLLNLDVPASVRELSRIVSAVRMIRNDVIVKVIVESALLMKEVDESEAQMRIEQACRAVRESGGDFIKTSSGFHAAGGASVQAVRWLKEHADGLKVKAAGGIRTFDDAVAMIEAGADRLGCSASVAIVSGARGADQI